MSICAVVLAGGSGTRLWPLSRTEHPKQFLALHGESTMLQDTISRMLKLDVRSSITICNENHRFFVAEQLREINELGDIILEPIARDTAPAVALGAFLAKDDPLLLVLAADHVIQNDEAFIKAVHNAIPLAEAGKLVSFGIVPSSPHTGYGYIKRGVRQGDGFVVDKFEEKPPSALAEDYVSSGDFYWNSGIFLFRASRYLKELKKFRPKIYNSCKLSVDRAEVDLDFLRVNKEALEACPIESIDYAVMENTLDAVVVPLNAGWSDIGSWDSLWEISEKNSSGNVERGDVITYNTTNSYVRSDEKLVTVIGVDNLVVTVTKDVVMIANKDDVQDVKEVVGLLKQAARFEWESHREVYRPWGKYDSIDVGERYQVKRITVRPGAKLSVQMHHHRAEHWVVVSGTASVTNGGKTFLLSENESTYIPVGIVHSLENPGKVDLEIIEVQSGSYLGEDDIVRYEDIYGRTVIK
ncbi:mannose-1-phosphate guanylyltransferase/mannose-6-phosphate isomerase [Pseudomonadales bacterium]|nr:mannose-1-phosphate guanylyltransferase/mannose-6-phosphate isomerase [Pseudomonadales bacterium]